MKDLHRAVEEAQRALWAADEAVRQAERDEESRRVDSIVAAHEERVAAAAGLCRAILELHGPQLDDLPHGPYCQVCFNSNGYEVNFPCPTYTLARDHADDSNERYDRAETTRRDAETEAAQLRAELAAVRHERDLLKEERW